MTIQQIYNLAIGLGIKADPRTKSQIAKLLRQAKKDFQELKPDKKVFYDKDRFFNPYSDSRILFGDKNTRVKTVLAGIDASVSEFLLAQQINSKQLTISNKPIDLVISHHPAGKALARLDEVMPLQADLLNQYGVPINIAEDLLEPAMGEAARKFAPRNNGRPVDAAKILNIPFACFHTIADNLAYDFLKKLIEGKKPETIAELTDLLLTIPEYHQAAIFGSGPKIFAGKPERRCGKIALTEVTGGTTGSKDIYSALAQAGVETILSMHMDEKHKEEAEKAHINVMIADHIASDSLGMNLLLDKLEKHGLKIIPCSGLIRVKRKT